LNPQLGVVTVWVCVCARLCTWAMHHYHFCLFSLQPCVFLMHVTMVTSTHVHSAIQITTKIGTATEIVLVIRLMHSQWKSSDKASTFPTNQPAASLWCHVTSDVTTFCLMHTQGYQKGQDFAFDLSSCNTNGDFQD